MCECLSRKEKHSCGLRGPGLSLLWRGNYTLLIRIASAICTKGRSKVSDMSGNLRRASSSNGGGPGGSSGPPHNILPRAETLGQSHIISRDAGEAGSRGNTGRDLGVMQMWRPDTGTPAALLTANRNHLAPGAAWRMDEAGEYLRVKLL